MTHPLDALFNPRTVAIIGASTDPRKISGQPVHYSKLRRFAGRMCPVNANATEVQGLPAFASLDEIDGPIDCAVVAVPAAAAVSAVEACAARGIGLVTVFSSGFAELDAAGRREQDRLAAIARETGVRILGPNCMGLFSMHSGFIATFTSAFTHHGGAGFPDLGNVSIVSQSGAIGVHVMVMLRDRGIGLSKWVTTGNQCDVDIADCIAYLATDEETRCIVVYMEGCDDGERLMAALEAARRNAKPVIILKVGTSEAGAAAAASHTASLAGNDALYDAVFRQAGAWRVDSLSELVDVAAAVSRGKFPASANVGLVTISGGVGILMADRCRDVGLSLPPLAAKAQRKLIDVVPFAATRNPIDTAAPGMFDMTIIKRFLEVTLAEKRFSSVVVFLTHLTMTERFAELRPDLLALRRRFPDPVVVLAMRASDPIRAELENEGFLIYDDPTRAIDCVAALATLGRMRSASAPTSRQPTTIKKGKSK